MFLGKGHYFIYFLQFNNNESFLDQTTLNKAHLFFRLQARLECITATTHNN